MVMAIRVSLQKPTDGAQPATPPPAPAPKPQAEIDEEVPF
jgi:hypothetical protein